MGERMGAGVRTGLFADPALLGTPPCTASTLRPRPRLQHGPGFRTLRVLRGFCCLLLGVRSLVRGSTHTRKSQQPRLLTPGFLGSPVWALETPFGDLSFPLRCRQSGGEEWREGRSPGPEQGRPGSLSTGEGGLRPGGSRCAAGQRLSGRTPGGLGLGTCEKSPSVLPASAPQWKRVPVSGPAMEVA